MHFSLRGAPGGLSCAASGSASRCIRECPDVSVFTTLIGGSVSDSAFTGMYQFFDAAHGHRLHGERRDLVAARRGAGFYVTLSGSTIRSPGPITQSPNPIVVLTPADQRTGTLWRSKSLSRLPARRHLAARHGLHAGDRVRPHRCERLRRREVQRSPGERRLHQLRRTGNLLARAGALELRFPTLGEPPRPATTAGAVVDPPVRSRWRCSRAPSASPSRRTRSAAAVTATRSTGSATGSTSSASTSPRARSSPDFLTATSMTTEHHHSQQRHASGGVRSSTFEKSGLFACPIPAAAGHLIRCVTSSCGHITRQQFILRPTVPTPESPSPACTSTRTAPPAVARSASRSRRGAALPTPGRTHSGLLMSTTIRRHGLPGSTRRRPTRRE